MRAVRVTRAVDNSASARSGGPRGCSGLGGSGTPCCSLSGCCSRRGSPASRRGAPCTWSICGGGRRSLVAKPGTGGAAGSSRGSRCSRRCSSSRTSLVFWSTRWRWSGGRLSSPSSSWSACFSGRYRSHWGGSTARPCTYGGLRSAASRVADRGPTCTSRRGTATVRARACCS